MTDSILDPQDNPDTKFIDLMPENQRDPEALAKKAYHGDLHIKMLEKRMDELRTDYLKEREDNQTRAKLEDLIKVLETKQLTSSEQPLAKEVTEKPTMDLNELDRIVSAKLQERETLRKQEENANIVRSKLKERYGDNYTSVVKEQIKTLDLTEDDFNALARRSPNALLKSLGADQKSEGYQGPPRTSNSFRPQTEKKRTWAYYQELKKSDPKAYHDPKTLIQMERDALELGAEFEDGDFRRFG